MEWEFRQTNHRYSRSSHLSVKLISINQNNIRTEEKDDCSYSYSHRLMQIWRRRRRC